MTDRSSYTAWHVYTQASGVVVEKQCQQGEKGLAVALEESAGLARRDREQQLGISRNFVQWLPEGMRPTKF